MSEDCTKCDWHDARIEKPVQGTEVVLLLENGEQHAGHWLEHANKYQRNTRRWKVYKWNKYISDISRVCKGQRSQYRDNHFAYYDEYLAGEYPKFTGRAKGSCKKLWR